MKLVLAFFAPLYLAITVEEVKEALTGYFDLNDDADHGEQQPWYDAMSGYVRQNIDTIPYTDGTGDVKPQFVKFTEWWQERDLKSVCQEDDPVECGGMFDLTPIWGYGCWCHFGSQAGKGRSSPVDQVDELCKALQQCYRCAAYDAKAEGQSCVPWSENYAVEVEHVNKGLYKQCMRSNPANDCAFHTCCCEMNFISNLFDLFFSSWVSGNSVYDKNLKHDQGNFNWETRCPSSPGEFTKGCCGDYPNRYIFNQERNVCCDGGLQPGPDCV